MSNLENGIYGAFLERGVINNGWKVKVTSVETKAAGSDWATVCVDIVKPRCRKPFMTWALSVYMPRDQIHFDKSTFAYF